MSISNSINTNIPSLTAQRYLGINQENQKNTFDRLSSGSRINKSADDGAGLAMSEKLKADILSMHQAIRNANDGVSLIQVAEGAMNEVGHILTRIRELCVQAASDTIGKLEREFSDKEVQELKNEINRIAYSTEYDGIKLLDGSVPPLEIQIGIKNNPDTDRIVFDFQNLKITVNALGLEDTATKLKTEAQQSLELVDQAILNLNENRTTLGALQNRLQSVINNLRIYTENLISANSRIRDTDMATEVSEMIKSNILTQFGFNVLSHANALPQLFLHLLK